MSDLLERTLKIAQQYVDSLAERPVRARGSLEELRELAGGELSDGGESPEEVLSRLEGFGERGTVASSSPRYFGFVIGGTYPIGMAADWLVSAWDPNPGLYATSPATSVMEEAAGRWVKELLALPPEAGFGFVTGCQMAHFTCLAAARGALLRDCGWDVEARGLNGAPKINIVISAEAHVTVHTSLRYLGFGTESAIRVPADDQGRTSAAELKRVLDGCTGPVLVCAQAGNVNTGAFDPLDEIADLCAARPSTWLHIDGAFGLWAAASPRYRHLVKGAGRADSWATDAHKWLNVPYDCGIAIVKDALALRSAMSVRAAYLEHSVHEERDPLEWVPEFSRRARSVPVYAVLRALGRRGVADLIDRCCSHARLFAEILGAAPGVEILNDVVLNQVLVRFSGSDEVTRSVIANVQQDGTCWLGGSTWKDLAVMRISVSNWQTSEDDVRRSCNAILTAHRGAAAS